MPRLARTRETFHHQALSDIVVGHAAVNSRLIAVPVDSMVKRVTGHLIGRVLENIHLSARLLRIADNLPYRRAPYPERGLHSRPIAESNGSLPVSVFLKELRRSCNSSAIVRRHTMFVIGCINPNPGIPVRDGNCARVVVTEVANAQPPIGPYRRIERGPVELFIKGWL